MASQVTEMQYLPSYDQMASLVEKIGNLSDKQTILDFETRITDAESKVTTLVGTDTGKSARDIIDEEMTEPLATVNKLNTEVTNLHTTTKFLISVSGWSTTATTVNGTDYFTYNLSCTVLDEHPVIGPAGTSSIPTSDEQVAFDSVDYAYADKTNEKITLYAEKAPTVSFYIIVKGAK